MLRYYLARQKIAIHDISILTKTAEKRHVSCLFQIKKFRWFQTQRFLRVEPTLGSRPRPGRAGPTAPGPARNTFESRAEA